MLKTAFIWPKKYCKNGNIKKSYKDFVEPFSILIYMKLYLFLWCKAEF